MAAPRSTPTLCPDRPTALALSATARPDSAVSAAPARPHLQSATPAAPMGCSDPVARTHHQLSVSPAGPPPSPPTAPHRCPPAARCLLRTSSSSVLTDWPVHSTPDSSLPALHRPARSPRVSALLALQTPAVYSLADNQPLSHSTHVTVAALHSRSTSARKKG